MRRAMLLVLAVLWGLLMSCTLVAEEKLPFPELSDSLFRELRDYLSEHRMSPEEYVVSKFEDHQIVIIGEQHKISHDPILIQKLIPRLYDAGVFSLCTEFGRREDQYLIDSLLNAPEYDDKLAQLITFNQFVHWSYREYVDIYRAAWELNHSLEPGMRRFRILGVNGSPEWYHVKTQEDRDNPVIRKKVWHGEGEEDWAKAVFENVTDQNEKALIYCGIHHAFSEYLQPVVRNGEFKRFVEDRFGRHLYNRLGKQVITIYLHHFWQHKDGWEKGMVYPAEGYIDTLMAALGSEWYPVGFDVKGTPFEQLPGSDSYYSQGYEGFNLRMFCDGYIFQKPFSEYEPVTCIEGFFSEDNIEAARRGAVNPWFRDKSVEDFEKSCEISRQEQIRWFAPLK